MCETEEWGNVWKEETTQTFRTGRGSVRRQGKGDREFRATATKSDFVDEHSELQELSTGKGSLILLINVTWVVHTKNCERFSYYKVEEEQYGQNIYIFLLFSSS